MSNIEIRVGADTTSLRAQFALAKAESSALASELNKLAKEATAAGGEMSSEMKASLTQAAEAAAAAQSKVASLRSELSETRPHAANLSETFEALNRVAAFAGMGLGLAELKALRSEITESVAGVAHQAEVVGMATDAYQAFSESAKLAGVDVAEVESTLKKYNVAVENARTGTGEQADAFRDLGVDAAQSSVKSLPLIARALLNVDDAARRSKDEVALFGRSGEDLNPVLMRWAEGVDVMTDRLKESGTYLGGEMPEKMLATERALTNAQEALKAGVTPAFLHLNEALVAVASSLGMIDLETARKVLDGTWAGTEGGGWSGSYGTFGNKGGDKDRERSEIAALEAMNGKLKEQKILTEEIGKARKALADATALHDQPGIDAANTALADFQQRLDHLNNPNAAKSAKDAQRMGDELAQVYQQQAERHIQTEERANQFLLAMGQETLDQFKAQALALEDARYKAELDGLHAREKADAGNAVALAKDQAEETGLIQEHEDRVLAIKQDYQQKQKQIRDKAEQDFTQEQIRAANDTASAQMNALEQVAKYSSMTAEEETAQALKIEKARDAAVNESLNVALKAAGQNADAQRSVNKQIEDEALTHQKRLDDITRQGLDLQVQQWSRFNQRITSAEDELVGDTFSANQSLWASLRQIGLHFLEQMVADDLKYWTERELLAAEGVNAENAAERGGLTGLLHILSQKTTAATAAQTAETTVTVTGQTQQTAATAAGSAQREAIEARENTSFLGRIVSQLARWLGLETAKTTATATSTAAQVSTVTAGETAKTGAVAAGTAAQTAIKTAGAAAGNAAEAAADSTSILNSAYTAAASAFKWVMQEVPWPLNAILAPVAAGVTFAAVAAFNVISAEGGAERIGADGPILEAHRDESVLPARVSLPLMSFVGDLPAIAEMARTGAPQAVDPAVTAFAQRLSTANDNEGAFIGTGGARSGTGSVVDLVSRMQAFSDPGQLLPVHSASAAVQRSVARQSDSVSPQEYLDSRLSGGGAGPRSSKAQIRDINFHQHIRTDDVKSYQALMDSPARKRAMKQYMKNLVRSGLRG